MATSINSTADDHIKRYTVAIDEAADQGDTAFHNWFNHAASVEEATIRGSWDFAVHILTPPVCAALSEPEKKWHWK